MFALAPETELRLLRRPLQGVDWGRLPPLQSHRPFLCIGRGEILWFPIGSSTAKPLLDSTHYWIKASVAGMHHGMRQNVGSDDYDLNFEPNCPTARHSREDARRFWIAVRKYKTYFSLRVPKLKKTMTATRGDYRSIPACKSLSPTQRCPTQEG